MRHRIVIERAERLNQIPPYSTFPALQQAGIEALDKADIQLDEFIPWYARRRDILVDGLKRLGWELRAPKAGVYVWVPTPPRYTSVRFSVLLRKAGVFVVPGAFMGEYGEGYVRFALNTPEDRLKTAIDRIEHSLSRRLRRLNASQPSLV